MVEAHALGEGGDEHVASKLIGAFSAAQPCQVSPHGEVVPREQLSEALGVGQRAAHKIGVIINHTLYFAARWSRFPKISALPAGPVAFVDDPSDPLAAARRPTQLGCTPSHLRFRDHGVKVGDWLRPQKGDLRVQSRSVHRWRPVHGVLADIHDRGKAVLASPYPEEGGGDHLGRPC